MAYYIDYIKNKDIRETYNEDTNGKKFPTQIMTKPKDDVSEDKNSEVVSYNLNKPMKYKEFKKLSDSSKREYINNLRTKYKVWNTDIADMLGIHFSTLTRNLKAWKIPTQKGGKRHKDAKSIMAWQEFLNGGEVAETPVVETPTPVNEAPDTQLSPEPKVTAPASELDITGTFTVSGSLNIRKIEQIILSMYPEDTEDIVVTVVVTKKKSGIND